MTPEQVKQRLADGEDPLDLSIEKWVDMELFVINNPSRYMDVFDMEQGDDNCGLCHRHRKDRCQTCPVANATGTPLCGGSPYSTFVNLLHYDSHPASSMVLGAIRAELAFLRSLKED